MLSGSDESRSSDRENLHYGENLEHFSDDLAYITQCLETLGELQELVSTCSSYLCEDGLSNDLSNRATTTTIRYDFAGDEKYSQ
jgi:hypothetical protein